MSTGINRTIVVRAGLAVLAAGAMLAGSYALVGSGDHFAVGEGGRKAKDEAAGGNALQGVPNRLVTRVRTTAELDDEAMVITVPLGVNFEVPGNLYGGNAKQPVALGPKNVKGMTQDGLGVQTGLMLPGGQRLLYHFWQTITPFPTEAPGDPIVADGTHMSTPTLRLSDLAAAEDTLLISGARSFALRADGTFAYAQGVDADYRYNIPYLQRVVVRNGFDGEPQVWTPDADRYTVLMWAGDALLVHREVLGGGNELLALRGPEQATPVLSEAERFLCLSPDGSRILTASGGPASGTPLTIRELEWETGREVTTVSLDGALDQSSGEEMFAISTGSWEGDHAVLALSPADLVVLSVEGDTLAVDELVTFQYQGLVPGSVDQVLLNEAGTKAYLVAREGNKNAELERTAVLAYELGSEECTRWITPGAPSAMRFVCNLSRPR